MMRTRMALLVLNLAAVTSLTSACGDGGDGPEAGVLRDGGLILSDHFIGENPDNFLSYFVEWNTVEPATSELSVDCGPALTLEPFVDDSLRTEHKIFVMGLVANASCEIVARSRAGNGDVDSFSTSIEVAPLPDFLPSGFEVEIDRETVAPGWTLANFHNHSQGGQLSVGLLDPEGRFRWYARLGTNLFGTVVQEVSAHDEGVLVGSQGEIAPAFIGWDGDVVWTRALPSSHHDVRRYPTADFLTYPTRGMPCGPFDHTAGGVDRMNLHTGEVVWSWDICGHFEPPTWRNDWAHINTYEPIPEENAFLLSLRNVSAILKFSEETGALLWHLGRGGDFELTNGEWFEIQHAPEVQPNGNILLFDNGPEARGYSRGIEIALDEENMTAEIVWEWAPEDTGGGWWCAIWGDADRLPNGNTLMTFGQADPEFPARLVEVTPEGEPAWVLTYSNVWASYRADRVAPPPLIRIADDLPREITPR